MINPLNVATPDAAVAVVFPDTEGVPGPVIVTVTIEVESAVIMPAVALVMFTIGCVVAATPEVAPAMALPTARFIAAPFAVGVTTSEVVIVDGEVIVYVIVYAVAAVPEIPKFTNRAIPATAFAVAVPTTVAPVETVAVTVAVLFVTTPPKAFLISITG
jgi:hypothetical protein